MISETHYIEIYVQGNLLELESQDNLNLRMNSVLFKPTQTVTKQAEYSFSFKIPSTPNNDKIFGYANTLSRVNKFHNRYSAEVYSDGTILFKGSLTVKKYNSKDKMYECNLVNIKVSSIDEIFGESTLSEVKGWEIDYEGSETINSVNQDYNSKYYFPLVSYGVFQKNPYRSDKVGNSYTPKHTLDKYVKWYHTSFYPSLNMLETVKKCFEWKGYTVGGNAFTDQNLKNIFMSTNLADGQIPKYNLGNDKFGTTHIITNWSNSSARGTTQDLSFPYQGVRPAINASNRNAETEYNFGAVNVYNMLSTSEGGSPSSPYNSYLYNPKNNLIVIPQDGWYEIELDVTATLDRTTSSFTASQWTTTYYDGDEFKQREVKIIKGLKELTPVEFQLVRNYDSNIELIKGKWNVKYDTGDPNQTTYTYRGGSYTGSTVQNRTSWLTSYPHEDFCGSSVPTVATALTSTAVASNTTGTGRTGSGGSFGGRRAPAQTTTSTNTITLNRNMRGYLYDDGKTMPYDQAVSPAFICGFSSLGNGTVSVMRNGRSWSSMSDIKNKVMTNMDGLKLWNLDNTYQETSYSYNTFRNAPQNYISVLDGSMRGHVYCCVYLNKDDVLQLFALTRPYSTSSGRNPIYGSMYQITALATLNIRAMSDRDEDTLRADTTFGYNKPTQFPKKLNLFNFLNKETKVSDFVNNVFTAFNLQTNEVGNSIDISLNQGNKKNISYTIDIDDRVSNDEAESELIDYPKEMAVKYKIDTEEWGFEQTVPSSHINDEDWKQWGDSGFTVISLSDDTYNIKSQTTSTNFSYTYYDNFLWKDVNEDGTERTDFEGYEIRIPVIEKSQYMVEGYGYDEAMAHDGYGQPQRFWYRDQVSQEYIWTSDVFRSKIYLSYPMNSWNGFNLSYKNTEKSIATEYFNIYPMLSSNYVNVDVYLTPKEFADIKNGALIHFDSDLYYVSEISGFDPSGNNTTKLKLIKKT